MEAAAEAEVKSILDSDDDSDAAGGEAPAESLSDVDFTDAVPGTAEPEKMPADEATDESADTDAATDAGDATADEADSGAMEKSDDNATDETPADDMPADETSADDAAAPGDDDAAAPADDAAEDDAGPDPKDSSKVDQPETIPAPPVAATRAPASGQAMRLWTDNTGKFQVRARLVSVLDGKVRLFKENGHFTTVALARLSAADLAFVQHQAPALAQK